MAADVLAGQSRTKEAIEAYLAAIDADPEYSPAYIGLARIFEDARRFDEALVVYREGAEANPNDIELHTAMASLLAKMKRIDEGLAVQARAASINPNSALTHQALGEIMLQKHDPISAIENFRRAVAIDPGLAASWNYLGQAMSSLGRFDEAADCFRRFLTLRPNSAVAYSNLVNTGRGAGTAEIDQLNRLLEERKNWPIEERIFAGFALGKLLDRVDRFDEAFSRYAEANRLVSAQYAAQGERYDSESFRKQAGETIETFTRAFFEQRRSWGNESEAPVFIVGMPRSGTTLVQQIAGSHPQVHGAGEMRDLIEIAMGFGGTDIRSAALGWSAGPVREVADRHVSHLEAMNASALRVIDKMPSNVHRVGLIAVLFPNARIIQCRRDARDTCLSCYFQHFSNGNLFSYDLANCAHEYRVTERLLNHWRDTAPLRILDVQYEELVADLEGQSRRLIEFLGLAWDPECLKFHRNSSAVLTSSAWQVRQPIYDRSAGRWKNYEKHLGPLMDVLNAADE